MEASTPPHITRRGIVALAKDELGLPFSKSHLDKLAMVGRGPNRSVSSAADTSTIVRP